MTVYKNPRLSVGFAVHRLVVGRFVRSDPVQHPYHIVDGNERRTVHRVVHVVHVAVLRVADDVHHRTVRAHRPPSPAHRQAQAHHHGEIVQRREEYLLPRVPGQLVVQSAQNAR